MKPKLFGLYIAAVIVVLAAILIWCTINLA